MFKMLYEFYSNVEDFVKSDTAGTGGRYQHIVIAAGGLWGVIMALISLVILVCYAKPQAFRLGYLLSPAILFMIGAIAGVSVTCTVAPRSFLSGPAGRKWMKLIGTERVVVARLVCGCLSILFVGLLVLFAWAAWSDLQTG